MQVAADSRPASLRLLHQVRARDLQRVGDSLHREPSGSGDRQRDNGFLDGAASPGCEAATQELAGWGPPLWPELDGFFASSEAWSSDPLSTR